MERKLKYMSLFLKKVVIQLHQCFIFMGSILFKSLLFYHYSLAKKYATLGNRKVFFVEYRLSLKNKYPTAVWDAYYSYLFLFRK